MAQSVSVYPWAIERERIEHASARSHAVLSAICVLGVALRVGPIGRESLWYDEVITVRHLTAGSLREYLALVFPASWDVPPVFFTLQYAWAQVFGPSEYAARGMSVVLGVAALYLAYFVGLRLYGHFAAQIAAAWVAFVPAHVYYAMEVRMYSAVLVAVLVGVYSLLVLRDGGHRAWWLVHGLANVFAVWTQPTTGVMLAVYGVAVLWHWRRQRAVVIAWVAFHAAMAGAVVVWFAHLDPEFREARRAWSAPPNAHAVKSTIRIWFGMVPFVPLNHRVSPPVVVGLMRAANGLSLIMAPALALLAWHAWQRRQTDGKYAETLAFIVVWMLLPGAILAAISYAWRPCFVPRYFLYSSPAAYIAVAGATVALESGMARRTAITAQCVVFAYFGAVVATVPARPDWRGLSHHVATHDAGDSVFVAPEHATPVLYYAGKDGIWDEPCKNYDCLEARAIDGLMAGRLVWVILEGRRLNYEDQLVDAIVAAGGRLTRTTVDDMVVLRVAAKASSQD